MPKSNLRLAANAVSDKSAETPVRVVVAPNALKGSLTASEAALAIARGLHTADSAIEIVSLPIADGGDGTSAVLRTARDGVIRETIVPDPLGRPVRASFGLLDDGRTAVLDVATASGLTLLQSHERDPLSCSSRGTGKLLSTALDAGVESVILGVGGSATVDGGSGLLAALGVGLLDDNGTPIASGGAGLARLSRIDLSRAHPALGRVQLRIACDVDSPLLGPYGAARAFGPQKGASPEAVRELEQNLGHFAQVIEQTTGREVGHLVSGGAAGGIAAGLFGVLGATLEPGIDLVLETLGFDQALQGADLVITAEGFLDQQSLRNKGPCGVARWSRRRGVPVIALVGGIADDVRAADFSDFAAIFPICRRPVTLEEAEQRAAVWLERAAETTLRAVTQGHRR
ncbi:MAG TPA: glycerate kinase [Polyangiaceae bacterium]|nr:glycerate kinase [Polyangiaceae bacterium]